jgi:NAD(P)-dependent dehydrogenase (short-subunit alcohol dehydrogenase family)
MAKTAIVTGGGQGLGRFMALEAARRGTQLVIADVNPDTANAVAAEIIAENGQGSAIGVRLDVRDADQCAEAVAAAVKAFGGCDVLVNNAGIGVSSIRIDADVNPPTLEEVTPEVLQGILNVNLFGPYNMMRATVPAMKQRSWGRVINITTSFMTMLRAFPYGSIKAALEGASAAWAAELEGTGVTVNVLVPGGPTDTAFIPVEAGMARDQMIRPDVMGPPAAWLASEASNGVTGQRFIAGFWDASLPIDEAVAAAGGPIGWPELALSTRIWPGMERGKGPSE